MYFCSVLEEFKKHINTNFLNLKDKEFLLACSGGIDSMVLAHLCYASNLNFSIAHCNFELRGEESNKDEEFVRKIAESYSKNCYEGLTGIPEKTEIISRPLLPFSRDQILEYAQKEKIFWREDKTNKETKYLRNNIRHKIVPLLKELHPTFLTNFLNTQLYLRQTNEIFEQHIEKLRKSLFVKEETIFKIEITELQTLSPTTAYIYHLFKPFGFSDTTVITDLFSSISGKEIYSKTHRLLKDRSHLLLQEIGSKVSDIYFIQKGENNIDYPVSLKIENVSGENGKLATTFIHLE